MPFDITVKATFSAAHQLRFDDSVEPLHGHDWRVTLSVGADALDDLGLVCDFHTVERVLTEVIAPFKNANLNEVTPFDTVNPTAERVAEHIGVSVAAQVDNEQARVLWCRVTEAPGCAARWFAPA